MTLSSFIDSDSFVEKNTAREIVKYFIDGKVGAVAGHTFVANAEKNLLTKMQSVRYFIAFKAYKSAEALFGTVTCCSGCCSAYRRSYILPFINEWRNQRFLGVKCTYGDDRSLTNYLLRRGYKTVFSPTATAHTFVPETVSQYLRQQLRWKKSWFRENLMAGLFIWKRNPLMSLSFYLRIYFATLGTDCGDPRGTMVSNDDP
jgi:hyaluronan synthase